MNQKCRIWFVHFLSFERAVGHRAVNALVNVYTSIMEYRNAFNVLQINLLLKEPA